MYDIYRYTLHVSIDYTEAIRGSTLNVLIPTGEKTRTRNAKLEIQNKAPLICLLPSKF